MSLVRDGLLLSALALVFVTVSPLFDRRTNAPVNRIGLLLIVTYVVLILSVFVSLSSASGFERKNFSYLPLDYPSLFLGSVASVLFGLYAVFAFRVFQDLLLYQERKPTRRNFYLLSGAIALTMALALFVRPLEDSTLLTLAVVVSSSLAVMNSFRLPWIVYLRKRDKMLTLIFSFLLLVGFIALGVQLGRDGIIHRGILYYSHPLKQLVQSVFILGTTYSGLAFVSTLFHLPTADAFDRKRSEVTSLHSLSRLITQVFDFNELVDTVMSMTLQVCEAKSCWLELTSEASSPWTGLRVVAMKNIDAEGIATLLDRGGESIRASITATPQPIVIDDIHADPRFAGLKKGDVSARSMVVMPLASHSGLIGILYVTQENVYGFLKDDVDVIAAFADQATVALENSRLIKESIERERLKKEMTLAHEMQLRLLPQHLPESPKFELAAVSTPAFEVGGDYYDFVQIDGNRLGIIVGDVSGKGVSAAFYMSEVKGIFQALSRNHASPRGFLVQANNVLSGSVDKHSFISLLFAVVDTSKQEIVVSRAGHCPMLWLAATATEYIRPGGMGLGLHSGPLFENSLEERTLPLTCGDVFLLFTDGITEARLGEDEFGYERLMSMAAASRAKSALEIRDDILQAIRAFTGRDDHDDDITLVVLKWKGTANDGV